MSRTQVGRSALALTLVLVAALAAFGALVWFVVRGNSARGLERAENPKVELPKDSQADLSAGKTPLEARSAAKNETGGAGDNGAVSTASGTGTLRIRVLDEGTRDAVPDLQFVAYRERGGVKELARGRTDARGRAELREIEANTIIVRTERKPPHAEQSGAAWLTPGSTKELEILVGAGGAIFGRVIDDLKRPVEGAALYHYQYTWEFEGFSSGTPEPEARSGSDGRFRLEHLASRPRSVWIVDGGMRPESWEPVLLQAARENIFSGLTVTPVPSKDVDVGDILLTRASIFAGHLLDANGKLVAGAVISLQGELDRGPSDPEFHLAAGDVLTDAAGGFELHAAPGPTFVVVFTREGEHQRLRLPQGKPGERVDGIELRLGLEAAFEIELVDAMGAPAPIPAPDSSSGGVSTPWRNRYSGSNAVTLLARTADGARERDGRDHSDADGKWRLRLQIDPRTIGEIEVRAAGYAPIVERSESGFPPLVQRKLALTPYPTFRVRLVPKDPQAKPLAGQGAYVTLQICMADPARHAAANGRCCGLGAYWNERWRGESLDLVLPVRRNAPFWIYARGPRPETGSQRMLSVGYADDMRPSGGPCDLEHIGPFEPGPDVHELVLDPAEFADSKGRPDARKPPEPSTPGEELRASLRARISDARTGKPIHGAYISMREVVADNARGSGATSDENGAVLDQPVLVGRWKMDVSVRGYQGSDLGEHITHRSETLELGTIALEPRPTHRGQILDADGAALSRAWLGVVAGPSGQNENGGLLTEQDGSFELIGELPPSFVLQTVVPAMHSGWGAQAQRFALEPWPEDQVKELRLAKFRKVVVTIAGLDPEGAELAPYVCPAVGEPTATCDHRAAHVPPHEALGRGLAVTSSLEGPRWAFLLAPGKYVVWGSNLMHDLTVTELEVTPGDTDIELTITAH